ncbi:glycosyltransferase [Candidatus Borrarchaeum sp.]|uniref:glycosyltransferase n=1 Tax=Candidatus Borrarchaeum sp. TaxID=2846742 RepID=UPI00257CEFA8|nr:glycosyltransferase [Candidatus Borrarchaeum sp.]
MFKALKIEDGNVKSTRRILFVTETDLEKSDGASVNDRKAINCLKKFGNLKCFYLKEMKKSNLLQRYLSAVQVLFWIIRKRPYVIFLRNIHFTFFLGLLKFLLRIKLVYLVLSVPFRLIECKLYEGTPEQLSKVTEFVIKITEPFVLRKGADILIVSNQETKRQLVEYGVDDKKIRIVPFYIESTFFDIPLKRERSKHFIIGYIGGFNQLHDLLCLIDVVKDLITKIKNLRLMLVGDGFLFTEIKDEVKKNNLEKYVTLLGRIPHSSIPKIIQDFDVFVLPLVKNFIRTALPIKILEAAASARPIILTKGGGGDKILHDTESCLLVRPESPTDISAAILKLYNSTFLQEKLGNAAREQVRKFSEKYVCKEYSRVLEVLQ